MSVAAIDDQRRVAAITAYDAVRTPPRPDLEAVVELAARIAEVPKATINLITDVEQHQVATVGFQGSVCRREGDFGPESAGLLDRAINGSTRMADLIDDVLDYATLGGTLKATEVDLDFVLGEVLEDLSSDLGDVTLRIDRLPTVVGDRAQLRAVLQNLLGNAAKFRAPDREPEVHVAARHVQRAWRIEITDNGRGVPLADRTRVFEPLARVDVSVDGSGIGLATCRRIIGAHGGRIGIDPTVTEGARFWFELPD